MITGELKNKIDKIWETFWTGGITNPLEVTFPQDKQYLRWSKFKNEKAGEMQK